MLLSTKGHNFGYNLQGIISHINGGVCINSEKHNMWYLTIILTNAEIFPGIPANCLEARVKTDKEWMIWGRLEDVFLRLNPVYIFIICHQLFLYNL